MYPLWPLTRTRMDLQDDLSAVERLGVAPLRLDPAQPQERRERVRGEPVVVLLRLETVHEDPDLLLAGRLVELNEEIGVADVAVVLHDFVLEDQVIPVRIPRQLGHQAMVLVEIVAIRREDDVRRRLDLQPFEELLDTLALIREEPIPEIGDDDFLPLRARQKLLGARDGFLVPPTAGRQNDPADARLLVLVQEPQDRPATADLDVVAVRAEAQQAQRVALVAGEGQVLHDGSRCGRRSPRRARRARVLGPGPGRRSRCIAAPTPPGILRIAARDRAPAPPSAPRVPGLARSGARQPHPRSVVSTAPTASPPSAPRSCARSTEERPPPRSAQR